MVHQPPYPPPPPTRAEKQRKILTIVGIAVGVVLILCIGGMVASQAGKKDDDGTKSAASNPTATATATESEPGKPADDETAEPPEPEKVKMPDLVGKNAAIAEDELERLGFTDVQLGSADPDDTFVILAANWTVVEQSHEPGDKVPTDALIVLTCSKKA